MPMSLRDRVARPSLGIIEPCLPSPANSGSGWIHEIKHDGFRILARRDLPAFGWLPAPEAISRRAFPLSQWP